MERHPGRWATFVLALLVLGPLCLVAGTIALLALVTEFFSVDLTSLFPTSIPDTLDWLAGGPGAAPGSFVRYATFMVSGVIAAIAGTSIPWALALGISNRARGMTGRG